MLQEILIPYLILSIWLVCSRLRLSFFEVRNLAFKVMTVGHRSHCFPAVVVLWFGDASVDTSPSGWVSPPREQFGGTGAEMIPVWEGRSELLSTRSLFSHFFPQFCVPRHLIGNTAPVMLSGNIFLVFTSFLWVKTFLLTGPSLIM